MLRARAASAMTPASMREQRSRRARPRSRRETWPSCGRSCSKRWVGPAPSRAPILLEAHPVSLQKNVFTIGFDPEFEDHIGLVDNARNHTLLQTKLPNSATRASNSSSSRPMRPRPPRRLPRNRSQPPAPAPASKAAPQAALRQRPLPARHRPAKEKLAPVPFSKDDFKNDPLIQKALEIFKGQIVEVRA